MQRRILLVVERSNHVVRRRQRVVAVQLAARQADQMRRVQPRVLRVDRHKHLHDVVFGHTVEDDRRHGEIVVADVVDVRVQREQAVLAVDRAKDSFALRHLQTPDRGAAQQARTTTSRRTK